MSSVIPIAREQLPAQLPYTKTRRLSLAEMDTQKGGSLVSVDCKRMSMKSWSVITLMSPARVTLRT